MALSNGRRMLLTRSIPLGYVGLAVILLAGCLTSRQVIPVSYQSESAKPSAGRIGDYETAIKAISYVMVEELKLPPVEAVVFIYPSLSEYESGFVAELELTPSRAAGMTHTLAIANCKHKKILANGHGLLRVPWRSRVKTLAHEMTHLTQYALENGRCGSPHTWIMEGVANWVAYEITESLKLDSFVKAKETFLEEVARIKFTRTLPLLNQMSTSADWDYWGRSLGTESTYAQSFLAVDLLIEQKGLPAAIEYFGLFGRSNNRADNFKTAFGEDVSVFEEKFNVHLKKLLM
jgi:hypothetical protein